MEQLEEKVYDNILNEINKSLEDILLMIQAPKLFICNYFSNVKADIDTYFVKNQIINETNSQWTDLINKIETYEQEYYKTCHLNNIFKEKIKLEISNIKSRIIDAKLKKKVNNEFYPLKINIRCVYFHKLIPR